MSFYIYLPRKERLFRTSNEFENENYMSFDAEIRMGLSMKYLYIHVELQTVLA